MLIAMDMHLYQNALQRIRGDTMCGDTLNRLKGKSAKDLLIESGQLNQIPVDIDEILDNYGVITVATEFKSLEKSDEYKGNGEILGLVLLNGKDVGLFCKESDSKHRQNFTKAHELGHCCLHSDSLKDGYVEFRDTSTIGMTKEIEASTFAGELLMPEHSLNNIINRLVKPSLIGLANIFDVSVPVMRKRLEVLGITYYDDDLDKIIVPVVG